MRRSSFRSALLPTALLALLATACSSGAAAGSGGAGGSGGAAGSGGGEPCPDPPDPQVFEVGTGHECFERVTAGHVVPTIQGPQGGFHLWLAIGCSDCAEKTIVRYGVKDAATNDYFPDSDGPFKVLAHLQTTGWPQRAGFTAFLPGVVFDPETQLEKGHHVILTAAALGPNDEPLHEQEIDVVLGDIEIWSPPCDMGPNCGAPGGNPCCTKG